MKKYFFAFHGNDIMLERSGNGKYTIPCQECPPHNIEPQTNMMNVSPLDGIEVKACLLATPIVDNTQYEMCGLRQSYYKIPHELYLKAGKCKELLYWDANTRFCGVCGFSLRMNTDISKRCDKCGKEIWPQLSTAIIVLVHRGNDVLLVHANNFKGNFFGLVAGFVETGETLEEAVHREVMEETGIKIKNLRYFGSQPWPYPCGLMIGFDADYDGGLIKLQQSELSAGSWFNRKNLPEIPEKLSIARKLIDAWLQESPE